MNDVQPLALGETREWEIVEYAAYGITSGKEPGTFHQSRRAWKSAYAGSRIS
jgi:hypothetical protein